LRLTTEDTEEHREEGLKGEKVKREKEDRS
jgi:hypothetical protein